MEPTTFSIEDITIERLANFRLATDPLADSTVAELISSGEIQAVNEVLQQLFRNDDFEAGMFADLDPKLSSALTQYIESSGKFPSWMEPSKIKKGEALFVKYGPEIFMLLNVSSLPMCYTCAKGAQVLFETGRLLVHNNDIDPLARRLMETAQMVLNVLSTGGLSAKGKGVVTIQKVRLIHASIRHYLKSGQFNSQPWDVGTFGEPINQEDLAGTLMSFGPVILAGLKRLGITLNDEEMDAYMHCWKVVGHLMGIDPQLLPDNYPDGYALATKILQHQGAASEAGKELTASCIRFISYVIPGNSFDDMPGYLMHYFLQEFSAASGTDLSKCIGLDTSANLKDKLILKLSKYVLKGLNELEEHTFVANVIKPFNRMLLQGIIHHFNGGKGVQFYIPPSLQKNWGLSETWKDAAVLTPDLFGHRLVLQRKTQEIN